MSERLWDRADEWVNFAPCVGKPDFTIAPEGMSAKRATVVQQTCKTCLVRPECIALNTSPITNLELKGKRKSNSIWVAGVWLPDIDTAPNRRELEKRRGILIDSLPEEHQNRPIDALL